MDKQTVLSAMKAGTPMFKNEPVDLNKNGRAKFEKVCRDKHRSADNAEEKMQAKRRRAEIHAVKTRLKENFG